MIQNGERNKLKYCILIIDGAAGLPLPQYGSKTCLELAQTPNLDAMVREGILGMARTIPAGLEASSSNACMSLLGYDPKTYRIGRAAIEARSLGIPIADGEDLFRCNLVTVMDGKMRDYSAGHIENSQAQKLIESLNKELGDNRIRFFPGLSYRHILKIKDQETILQAHCTPPHDISGRPVDNYLPHGPGSELLLELMKDSERILREHPVNLERQANEELPANMAWIFWGSSKEPHIPAFKEVYGLDTSVTSAVDVINGLALILGMNVLKIPGVTDGMDNDFTAQVNGALASLDENDMAVIHIEAPDEAGHSGDIDEKIEAIRLIDEKVISRIRDWKKDSLRVLVMPDHPTPIETRTHNSDPVPFLLWGDGFPSNGAERFTEKEAENTGFFIDPAYQIMRKLAKEN